MTTLHKPRVQQHQEDDFKDFQPHENMTFAELCRLYRSKRDCFYKRIDFQPDFITAEFPIEVSKKLVASETTGG